MKSRTSRMALFTLLAATFATSLVVANETRPYPSSPIKMIVPFAPGGPVEVMVPVVVQRLSVSLGQVIVDNRPGAGGIRRG
jgi:tripartite-type tricarboxylate transporter receptor subunit TctC